MTDGNNLSLGKTEVTVSYTENGVTKTAKLNNITVVAKSLVDIEITKMPIKATYIEGQNFDKAGMVVTAFYNNNTSKVIGNYTIANGDNLQTGRTTITIRYTENGVIKTVSFDVEAIQQVQSGDISGDDQVNVTDLLLLKRHLIAGTKENWKLTGDKLKIADLNDDGNINITDLLLLKRMILKKN